MCLCLFFHFPSELSVCGQYFIWKIFNQRDQACNYKGNTRSFIKFVDIYHCTGKANSEACVNIER